MLVYGKYECFVMQILCIQHFLPHTRQVGLGVWSWIGNLQVRGSIPSDDR